MEARATLQDIATLAGVGKATVSLALRNHPKISAATRARVQAAAEQLHYRPDPALARIAAHRWRSREHPSDLTLAFITMSHPWTHDEPLIDLRLGATAQADRLGYRLEHFRLDDFPGPEQLARVLFHRGIRGVIVGTIFREDFAQRFPWENFVGMGCHIGYHQPPVNVVIPDFHHAVVRAWREAVNAGYRRIGLAMLRELEAVDLFDKVSAALFCQERLNPELNPIPLQHFPLEDHTEFRAWMRQHQPDVVIGFNDVVHWWLREGNFRVPNEVAFISLDTQVNAEREGPMLSGMNPDYEYIGRTSVSQLDILLRTNQQGIPERPLTVHVPSVWVPGETLPVRSSTEKPTRRKIARTSVGG
ncbi:MAG TPA: LacI family DNA-binding transcriptional regulator [Opitutus sp.]|jgi:LacI family transcriptional regulator|nr:LacI family DNA-binding transcriptional regulator [Opitutus sp.]